MTLAAVVIGRNEGQRLVRCLASLQGRASPVVYVDSGSTDGSPEAAESAGAIVVELDLSRPFTAARARNAGLARLGEIDPEGDHVQFLDGDCEIVPGWIEAALETLTGDSGLAVVCGRRRERHPEASLWNRLIDAEWDTPVGEALECGGDALMRRAALAEVGGYRDSIIAGEEPELCFRLRQKGWRIRRIDVEMTRHDAALSKFSQWWKRTSRGGHAFAECAALHGRSAERFRVAETRRALVWGAGLPLALLVGLALFGGWALALLLALPAQVVRLRFRGFDWTNAFFLTLGKFPEAQGVASYWTGRLLGRRRQIMEYK